MNKKPLKSGKMYEQLPNGEFVEVDAPSENVAPIPAEDLPPDLRPEAAVKLEPTPTPVPVATTKVRKNKPKRNATAKKAEKIINDIQNKLNAALKPKEPAKPKVTEQDRYAFLRAVVANRPFTKEYSLLNGKVKVTFKTVTAAEAEAVTEAIVIQSNRVPYTNLVAMSSAHFKYSMACAITQMVNMTEDGIVIRKFESPFKLYSDEARLCTYYVKEGTELKVKEGLVHAAPGQKVIWASVDHFADINISMYNLLFKCFQQFDALVAELAKEAIEPDFFLDGASGQ